MMNQKKKRQANQDCLDQGKKNPKKAKKMNWKKQASEKESTDHDETENNRKEQEQEAKKRRRERQSNCSGKSNFLPFKNSIKALVNISH